jgi:hypothetical protein
LIGCGSGPRPPYTLAFAADGRAPRLLHAAEETAVPLTVRNTGHEAWDAAGIHVSYHWLWLVPREIAKRSRTVPFHDGIRTEIGMDVPAGGGLPSTAGCWRPTTQASIGSSGTW